jgi:glycosyltransferase involved in cell wall biosynthesis
MALPLLDEIDARHVVYDCMDELGAFKNPPPGLEDNERALLARADLVFTGGPSLYNAKRHRHPRVHCFPSSVDVAHFRQALDRNLTHPTHRSMARPRLGFYGVIDERFDAALVQQIADAHPEWQIVLVGPVAKVDPALLPVRHNIHYLGHQPYSALPQFLAAWDVCLMPFMMNDATRFISPTKSLEYMAAELPIVSTPVRDVVDLHGDVIEIARTPEEFIAACERVLRMEPAQMQQKIHLMRERLALTSWNATAEQMRLLLAQLGQDEAIGVDMLAAYARDEIRMVGMRE